MHATILNGAKIGTCSIIGAGALVTENMVVPPFSLVVGVPGKVVKTLDESIVNRIQKNADTYQQLGRVYSKKFNE
jgi:carbonic anhydrase/acetyltransferase-like protein (isoleucine patch superfamily)